MKKVIQQTADKWENCGLCCSFCISLCVRRFDL